MADRTAQDVSLADLQAYLLMIATSSLASVNPTLFIVNEAGSLVSTSVTSLPLQKTEAEGAGARRSRCRDHGTSLC